MRLTFRPENIETIPASHPSLQHHGGNEGRSSRLFEVGKRARPWPSASKGPSSMLTTLHQIIDITGEIIRDYWNEVSTTTSDSAGAVNSSSLRPVDETCTTHREPEAVGASRSPAYARSATNANGPSSASSPSYASALPAPSPPASSRRDDPATQHSSAAPPSMLASSEASQSSPRSLDLVRSAAAHLLDLGGPGSAVLVAGMTGTDVHDALQAAAGGQQQSSEASPASDGIFLPGSAYLEFHSALRHHTFNAARSAVPSRCATPESPPAADGHRREGLQECGLAPAVPRPDGAPRLEDATISAVPTPTSLELSQQQEYELWKNWVDEIAPWVSQSPF